MTAFAFFANSHVNDSTVPSWLTTEGVDAFFVEVLHLTAAELLRKFGAWKQRLTSDRGKPYASRAMQEGLPNF